MALSSQPQSSTTPIFVREQEGVWRATPLAQGPYEGLQGGAVAALMAQAIERSVGEHISSLTTHFLRPAPVDRLKVTVRPVRIGRRVAVVDAELASAKHGVIAVQRASRIAPAPADLPTPPGEGANPATFPAAKRYTREGPWIMETMDVRIGPDGRYWFRQTIPLFEPFGALARLMTPADFAHGLVAPLGAAERPPLATPNADVTLHIIRPMQGEWVGLEPAMAWSQDAIGAGWAALYDTQGLVGRVAMSVAIMPRRGA